MNDIFHDHRIKEQIDRDIDKIKSTNVMRDFVKNLEYKSKKSREVDEAAMDFMFSLVRKFANGMILANARQTTELRKNALFMQELTAEFETVFKTWNDSVNRIIKTLVETGQVPEETLKELRECEIKIREAIS